MKRAYAWLASHRGATTALAAAATTFALVSALGVAQATDSPAFCRSACHEMTPFASAWEMGPHAGVACIECHVDPGMTARLLHKREALGEVWSHFQGDVTFPLAEPSGVPDSRCLRCHENVLVEEPGFDHDAHAARGSCDSCHADVGHEVSDAALEEAGVFNPDVEQQMLSATVAVVDGGTANISGHVEVSCSNCHDMAKTGCSACHEAKHEDAGSAGKTAGCETCHEPGASFAFSHPKDAADCADCHAAPEEHRAGKCQTCHTIGADWSFEHPSRKSDCTTCHDPPKKHSDGACTQCHPSNEEWSFEHPSASKDCSACHERPAKHLSGACTTCHKSGGTSWSFRHPGASSVCTSCHTRPAKHRSGSCTTCHTAGRSWGFRHPSSSSRCTTCHTRPAKHRSGSCTTCHRAGSTWAFKHTSSSSCSSCHKPPSKHYGASCASCHSPTRSWSSARFSHPRIRGGEHTYRSFACSKCHPSGYRAYTCAGCHSSSAGPKDGDDDDDDD